ncbi:hypothetical protein [Sphingomonas sp. CARO-RG-8B-R24-01]|uniref:hypothetical protein n=1 Tax=Sphingomonas sp. CARO-RG-8B-R24-01 TaxID=2914831 RepID=UPI001F56B190|nr:hypothetical protein [Sphingomonas sp. CARO-RG-8B-R24-01]
MSALLRIQRRTEAHAVLIVRKGIGWHTGVGSIITVSSRGAGDPFVMERGAVAADVHARAVN